ncbi:CGNR zinc finger domain-containing protein [Saccharibacillus sp. CPCC 101409]|uniref:CGNR zinc finger domain-containing protein n=1 Tax=Saccharibacillus sp. CPCC 101409 TaxID=3058041 RepID=UPI0026725F06|nr:CGNR zinc finger domain-containing protein [Saccharibacillus sp. CPCC 101409]MDO3408599.1 CGNR zinc finger domain-containing protein [Saccharibacillus sp. CPCC 101409]
MSERNLAIEVMNSMWYDHLGTRSEDRLDRKDWLEAFLDRWNVAPAARPNARQLKQLKELRTLLRDILRLASAGEELAEAQLEQLNGYLGRVPRRPGLVRRGGEYVLADAPAEKSWDAFLAESALSFAAALAEGRIRRIKLCGNPDCKWVFYDDTKNGKRQWCNSEICGNLARVRRHRDKQ